MAFLNAGSEVRSRVGNLPNAPSSRSGIKPLPGFGPIGGSISFPCIDLAMLGLPDEIPIP